MCGMSDNSGSPQTPQTPQAPTPPVSPFGFGSNATAANNLLSRTWYPSGGNGAPQGSFSQYAQRLFQPWAPGGGGDMQNMTQAIFSLFNKNVAPPTYANGTFGGSGQQQPGPGSGGTPMSNPTMPSFGGWAWGNVPVDNVIKAGFNWFEVGYPDSVSSGDYNRMRSAGITPFAYINLGEQAPDMAGQTRYDGPILRTNGDWGTQVVDVTNPSWQEWLVRRAQQAYSLGARGIKWDVATPDVPPGKSRQDVNAAIANVMQRIRSQYPDMRFIYNQGFDFAKAYPQYVNGVETEGLFSASSYPSAYLQPWKDPWYWGPQYNDAKALAQQGIPIFAAEYTDPWGGRANELYNAIVSQGFVPYITSENWQTRGRGYNINPGW